MKIPVILVTGFLGSGKTTFLKRLAENHPEWRLVFLVNEFAQSNIDGESLATAGTPTQSVVGGSLFCNCKAAEFVRVMNESVLNMHQQSALDAVIIETSGIADPQAIGKIMGDFHLNEHFSIQRVLCITSPSSLLKLIGNLPNMSAQIRTSDLIIINKTDLATEEEINKAEQQIKKINPTAEMTRSVHCSFEFALTSVTRQFPDHDLSTYEANPYTTKTINLDKTVSAQQLQTWFSQLPDCILRVKGNILTDQGWFRLEKSSDSSECTPIESAKSSTLVIIVHDDEELQLEIQSQRLNKL